MSSEPTTIDVKIMVLVGSNGKVTACKEGDRGWGDLADDIMNWPERGQRGEPTDPETSTRAIVMVTLPMPALALVQGSVVSTAIVAAEEN